MRPWLILCAGVLLCRWARAEETEDARRTTARNLGYAGIEAYEARDYAKAEARLNQAYRLLPAPSLGLWSARALSRNGKLVEAVGRYEEVARLPVDSGDIEIQRSAQAEAQRERDALLAVVPTLEIELVGAEWNEVRVTVNGVPVRQLAAKTPLRLNAGTYVVVARRGDDEERVSTRVQERDRKSLPLDFTRTSLMRVWAYPAWAIGALGLGVFVGVGTLALAEETALRDDCSELAESPDQVGPGMCLINHIDSRKSDYQQMFTLADIGLVAGAAGLTAGTALYLLSSHDSSSARSARLSAGFSLGAVGIAGVASFVLLTASAQSREKDLRACTPLCPKGHTDGVEDRYTLAKVSLGVGLAALAGATWVLLSDDSEDDAGRVARGFQGEMTENGVSLSFSDAF
jgi:hypothetical protein